MKGEGTPKPDLQQNIIRPQGLHPDTFGFIMELQIRGWPRDLATGEPVVDDYTKAKLIAYATQDLRLKDLANPQRTGWKRSNEIGNKLFVALTNAYYAESSADLRERFPVETTLSLKTPSHTDKYVSRQTSSSPARRAAKQDILDEIEMLVPLRSEEDLEEDEEDSGGDIDRALWEVATENPERFQTVTQGAKFSSDEITRLTNYFSQPEPRNLEDIGELLNRLSLAVALFGSD